MSKWVIMQTTDGCSQPVAIRNDHEKAMKRAEHLATEWSKKPGRLQNSDMGSRIVHDDVAFLVIEVDDVE